MPRMINADELLEKIREDSKEAEAKLKAAYAQNDRVQIIKWASALQRINYFYFDVLAAIVTEESKGGRK